MKKILLLCLLNLSFSQQSGFLNTPNIDNEPELLFPVNLPETISIEKIPIYIDLQGKYPIPDSFSLFEPYSHDTYNTDKRYDSFYILTGGEKKERFSTPGFIAGAFGYSLYWGLIFLLAGGGDYPEELIPLSAMIGVGHMMARVSDKKSIAWEKVINISCYGNGENTSKYIYNLKNGIEDMLISQIPREIQQLNSRTIEYNSVDHTTKVLNEKNKELKPFGVYKGEFETTKQYKKRLKDEKGKIQRIDERYDIKLSQAQEREQADKNRLIDKIKKICREINLYKHLPFEVSNYNADIEMYLFKIKTKYRGRYEHEINRYFSVPLSKAPKFKETVKDLSVNRIYQPYIRNPESRNITIGWKEIPDSTIAGKSK